MQSWVKGKRVVVVGLGASGVAAARLCLRRGASEVVATDSKPKESLSEAARALEAAGARLLAGHDDHGLAGAEVIVVSPGVPDFPALLEAERAGVPVWSEIELSTRELFHPAPIVAIGGTNGKSTTTSLVGELLAARGAPVFVGGNLGEPLSDHADERFAAVVLEVSSFQMERVDRFHPASSVLLNVTPDHLDRYPDFAAYARAKGNAFLRQTEGDVAVVPRGDAVCAEQAARGQGRVLTFGPGGDFDVEETRVVERATGAIHELRDVALQGRHNAENVAAALAAVSRFDVSPATAREVLARFQGLPHRTAFVREVSGVRYYDDSKGTNVGASVTALLGMREPKAVLIAGGRDKGGSYAPLAAALEKKGRAVVLIGEAQDAIARAVEGLLPVHRAKTMVDAVLASAGLAQRGDAVLLSPACSSFDMFTDYKQRGDVFVAAVAGLEESAR